MARIRSIHPTQWTDEEFVTCSAFARLLAIGIRNEADDQGIFEYKPLTIKMRLFPADNVDVEALLTELERSDQIRVFDANGKKYGAIKNFRKFQRPEKPNAIFQLPPDLVSYVGLSTTGCGKLAQNRHELVSGLPTGCRVVEEQSGNNRRSVADQSPKVDSEGTGGGGGTGKDKEREKKAEQDVLDCASFARDAAALPPDENDQWAGEIIEAFDQAITRHFGLALCRKSPSALDLSMARRWLAAGATVRSCADVIESVVWRQKASGSAKPPGSLKYFDGAIREALAVQSSPSPDLSPPAPPEPLSLSEDVLQKLRFGGVTEDQIRNFFNHARFELDEKIIFVRTKFIKDYLDERLEPQLHAAFGSTPEIRVAV